MKTISITGPESSGKTTLAIGLSKLLKESFVKEYSRKYLNKKKKYTIKDLNRIAIKQLKKITEAESKTNNFLITDTSIIDIRIWSEIKYNKCSNKIISKAKKECFDYYLLCKPDFPWVKDSYLSVFETNFISSSLIECFPYGMIGFKFSFILNLFFLLSSLI